MTLSRLLLVSLLSLAAISRASAHAFLDHAEPRVGSTVHPAPAEIKVWMTEELEPAFTKLQVFDAGGKEVDKRDTRITAATMVVSLPPLGPGIYQVRWKAVSTDTHETSGTFNFTVQ